jgi:hypothetical protein
LIVAAEQEEKKYRKQQKKARKTLWVCVVIWCYLESEREVHKYPTLDVYVGVIIRS